MNFLDNLNHEQIESLATLWTNKDFKVLKEVLEGRIKTLAKHNLKPLDWETTQDVRWEATACLRPIKLVEQAHKKVIKGEQKNANK